MCPFFMLAVIGINAVVTFFMIRAFASQLRPEIAHVEVTADDS